MIFGTRYFSAENFQSYRGDSSLSRYTEDANSICFFFFFLKCLSISTRPQSFTSEKNLLFMGKLSENIKSQLDAIEYLFVFFQLDMFRAYTPIFRSNGCYNFFTYTAYESTQINTQLHQVGKLIHNSNQNARYNYPNQITLWHFVRQGKTNSWCRLEF